MMNHKVVNINHSAKRVRHRNKSAVLHNGSFITEAFPAKGHEVYEDVEGGAIDSCLHYPVFGDANVVVVSTGTIAQDHEIGLPNPAMEADGLTSVDQLFSLCADGDKQSQDHPVQCVEVSEDLVENLSYETGSSVVVVDSVQLPEVSGTLGNDERCYSNSATSKTSNSHSPTDNSLEIEITNSTIAVYPKVISGISSNSSHNHWNKSINNTVTDSDVPNHNTVQLDDKNSRDASIIDCVVDCNTTGTKRSSSDTNDSNESVPNPTPMEYVSDLPKISIVTGAETPKIYPEEPLHIFNAVTTDDGAIEIVDSAGRTFRIQPTEDGSNNSASDPSHAAVQSQSEESSIIEQTYFGTAIPLIGQTHQEHVQIINSAPEETQVTENSTSQKDETSCAEQSEGVSDTLPDEPPAKKCQGLVPVVRRRGGWPKGKKRKNDRFRIKAPKTAYLLFAKNRRKELMIENPNYSFSEATVIMGRDWTALDPHLKKDYKKLAEQDQTRFATELKEYQQTDEYKTLLKRKRDETSAKLGGVMDEDLGYVEEEYTLFCHICNQRFSSRHNRKEHLAGRVHLKNLEKELRKQQGPTIAETPKDSTKDDETNATGKERKCCKHCVNRVVGPSIDSSSEDVSLDINSHIESFLYRHSQRELEVQMLKDNLKMLKETNSQLSKELITIQETVVKAKQEIQSNKQWQMQLAASIDNLKMVPTLFGVINF